MIAGVEIMGKGTGVATMVQKHRSSRHQITNKSEIQVKKTQNARAVRFEFSSFEFV